MTFTATQIAQLINGKIEGDPKASVDSFGKIEEAVNGQLSFFANPRYEEFLYKTEASILIINEDYVLKHPLRATVVRVPDAYSGFAVLLSAYQDMMTRKLSGIQQPAFVSSSASCGENVFVGAFSYLGDHVKVGKNSKIFSGVFIGDNAVIGDDCILHPGVKIYHDCIIGNKVTIHGGTIIGSDGFGFAPQPDGSFKKIPQIGNVVIEDNVEIGSNTTIDRATMGSTIIHEGVKLDNLIQVAHNVEIGNSTVIAAQSGISGSTKIGSGVMIGGQVGIVGHIQIGDGAKINAQSGVSKSIEPGKAVTGSPAHDYTAALRSQALNRKLPELEKRIQELETLVKQLISEKIL